MNSVKSVCMLLYFAYFLLFANYLVCASEYLQGFCNNVQAFISQTLRFNYTSKVTKSLTHTWCTLWHRIVHFFSSAISMLCLTLRHLTCVMTMLSHIN